MGLIWNATFENNNASELSAALTAGFTISSAQADASTYSLKVDSTAAVGAETILKDGLNYYTIFSRCRLYVDHLSTPGVIRDAPFLVWRDQSDNVIAYVLHRALTTGFGGHRLFIVNQIGGTFTSELGFNAAEWTTIETKLVISPTVGLFQLRFVSAGIVFTSTLSAQDTGTSPVKSLRNAGGGFTEFQIYTDNWRVLDNIYPGDGEPIAPRNNLRPRAFAPGLAR